MSTRTAVAAAAIAIAAYVISLTLLFPGYFHPLAPHHSDLYIPAGLVQEPWHLMLPYPRPVAFFALKLIGYLGVQGSIAAVVFLVLAAIPATVLLVEQLSGRKPALPAIFAYSMLLLAHPEFYFQHRHDVLAALSYLMMCAAVFLWLRGDFLPCLTVLLGLGLTKETYMGSTLILLAGTAWLRQRKVPVRQLAGAGAVVVAALAWNISRYHVYVAQAPEYDASFDPLGIARGFWFYLQHLFTPAAAVLALALSFQPTTALLFVAGIAALGPQSTLPNHLFEEYAWTAAPLVFAPVLAVTGRRLAAVVAGAAIVVVSYWPLYRSPAREWQLVQEKIGRNVLASIDRVRQAKGPRVLVTGLESPFSPWSDANYVAGNLDGNREWTVITPRDGPVLRKARLVLTHAQAVSPAAFDSVIEYDRDGNLVSIGPGSPEALAVPAVRPYLERLRTAPDDFDANIGAGSAYLAWGSPDLAEPYLERALKARDGRNPYPLFFLGQVAEARKENARARELYERAAALEPKNAHFTEALNRLRR